MVIVGEDVRNALEVHHLHGNAVGRAIILIEAGFVKGKRIEKEPMTLWKNGSVRTLSISLPIRAASSLTWGYERSEPQCECHGSW